MMQWIYNDGGRTQAGFKGETGDCATRAVAIATRVPYREVYDLLNSYATRERPRSGGKRSDARTGYHARTLRKVMDDLGWTWVPTMQIGSGTTVHLRDGELPAGRLVVRLSKHFSAIVDGVIYDTHDPSRDGTRAVYGYWTEREEA
jgi:hypothetical protein